jgi:hypothetical protein
VVSLVTLFWLLVVLMAVIGAMRGWSKELLVTSALVLGLFLNAILESYVGAYRDALHGAQPVTQFIIVGGLLVALSFFGYQSPNLPQLQPKVVRQRLEEMLLGFVLGGLNGYLLVGSLWSYLHKSGYPVDLIVQPEAGSALANQIASMMEFMPPSVLPIPYIYFAVGIVFVLVIVVFV